MNLASLRAERHRIDVREGYTRRRALNRHFSLEWIAKQPGRVFSRGESVTVERKRLKYVRRTSPYFPFTAGELARAYLGRLMREQLGWARISPHYKLTERDERLLSIPAPLAFYPERGREGKFVYVDIVACYFSLFWPWALNAIFDERTGGMSTPRPALRIPQRDLGWLEREKGIRHSLFGMMYSQSIGWYKDGASVAPKPILSAYCAPDIVALVLLSCHAIARVAVDEFDCRMWLTDAGIFPEREGLLFQLWLADKWRLASKPKAYGWGHLWSQGNYRVGRVRTKDEARFDLPGWDNLVAAPAGLAERRAWLVDREPTAD